MNNFFNQDGHFNQDGQYRRPRPHFSMEEAEPTVTRRQVLTGSALLLALALVMVLAMIPLRSAAPDSIPDAAQVNQDAAQALQKDCAVIQQMTYQPCGHQMTRRQALPAELAGQGREALAAAYDGWQVTSFSPAEVSMSRVLSLFCPQHIVLLPDEGGMLCAWQNKYGDALALVKELHTPVSELPDSTQDTARQGKAFDTLDALEKWLEDVAS